MACVFEMTAIFRISCQKLREACAQCWPFHVSIDYFCLLYSNFVIKISIPTDSIRQSSWYFNLRITIIFNLWFCENCFANNVRDNTSYDSAGKQVSVWSYKTLHKPFPLNLPRRNTWRCLHRHNLPRSFLNAWPTVELFSEVNLCRPHLVGNTCSNSTITTVDSECSKLSVKKLESLWTARSLSSGFILWFEWVKTFCVFFYILVHFLFFSQRCFRRKALLSEVAGVNDCIKNLPS